MPVLFLHHQKDGCQQTQPGASNDIYLKVKGFNKSVTEFSYLSSGEAEQNHPCRSGYHMYYGASEEAANTIDAFMSKWP
jgi:hypothetical protein